MGKEMETKLCGQCGEGKVLDDFHKNRARHDGRQSVCKPCKKINDHGWYLNNKGYHLERNRILRKENRKAFIKFKSKHPCECGEKDPACLMFHHDDPSKKHGHVGQMINNLYSWESIMEEIQKCDIMCLNCHAKLHSGSIT